MKDAIYGYAAKSAETVTWLVTENLSVRGAKRLASQKEPTGELGLM